MKKIFERGKIDTPSTHTPNTQIHDRSLSSLDTGNQWVQTPHKECHKYVCDLASCTWQGVLDKSQCDNVCNLTQGRQSSPCISVSTTNKADNHYVSEISLKVVLFTHIHQHLSEQEQEIKENVSIVYINLWCPLKYLFVFLLSVL